MQFESLQAFIAMGGHGVFVWSVYGITVLVLSLLLLAPLRKNRRFFLQQMMLLKRQQAAAGKPDPVAVKGQQSTAQSSPQSIHQ